MLRIVILLLCLSASATAQTSAIPDDITDPTVAVTADPFGRETPRGMATGLLAALVADDRSAAANFLDLSLIDDPIRLEQAIDAFGAVLDRKGGLLPRVQLSSDAAGATGDGLAADEDYFAVIRTRTGLEDLVAHQVVGPDEAAIWVVSPRSIALVERQARILGSSLVERLTPGALQDRMFFGASAGDWLAVLLIAAFAAIVARLVTMAILLGLTRALPGLRDPHNQSAAMMIRLPASVFLGLGLFVAGLFFAGVSISLRLYFVPISEFLSWIVLGWLLWRAIDAIARAALGAMSRRGRVGAISVVTLTRRAAKLLIVILATMLAAGSFGLDLTGWLAALGIGGLAFALGAQKTIEHFVGSVSIISDQPIRIGDFCQVDGLMGTVEDIGMRSTRLRTLDRTIVTIPNGTLSQATIENFAPRDRFRFAPILSLVYDTAPDQLRAVLWRMRGLLEADPRVFQDGARVRFVGFGTNALQIEIFCYVLADDLADFLATQEDLNLSIMDVVAEAGTRFALPSRAVYMAAKDDQASPAGELTSRRTDMHSREDA